MRTKLILVILALLCLNTKAQRLVEESAPLTGANRVVLNFDFADNIVFKTWDRNEVTVKVSVDINENQDNDAYSLQMEKTSTGSIMFKEDIRDMKNLKRNQKVYDKDGNELYSNCHIDLDIVYEVFLPANTKIVLETIIGSIEAKNLTGELELKTISGDIDLTLPENTKADLDFSTISGEMYSDFEFTYKDDQKSLAHHYAKMDFEHELNGGGRSIELTTISGNIYFRKQ